MQFSPPYLVEIYEVIDIYICYYCPKSLIYPHVMQGFTSNVLLNEHISNCHIFNDNNFKNLCSKCLKPFSSTSSLNRHLKYINCQKPLPETKCEKCDKIFASNFNYERHVKIKHKN